MNTISIDPTLQAACPELVLGLLEAQVHVEPERKDLWTFIDAELNGFAEWLKDHPIKQRPTIAATRTAYKACGKEPSRYRPSAEALSRRIAQGKGLYRVNNVVDSLNLVSVKSGYSIGGFDLDQTQGPIRLAIAGEGLPYEAIGRGALNIAFFPTLFDETGPFGTPTSDSVRTMVRPETKRFLMVFYAFGGADGLQDWLDQSASWLSEYASATAIEQLIVRP